MKKTAVIAIATQALEEKGLGHKRAKDCAEHLLEALESVGALRIDVSPAPGDSREYDVKAPQVNTDSAPISG